MFSLKENHCYLVISKQHGMINSKKKVRTNFATQGIYLYDTSIFRIYSWNFHGMEQAISKVVTGYTFKQVFVREKDANLLLLSRTLTVREDGLDDAFVLENNSNSTQMFNFKLDLEKCFLDLFQIRGFKMDAHPGTDAVEKDLEGGGKEITHVASDGIKTVATVILSHDKILEGESIRIEAGEKFHFNVTINIKSDLAKKHTTTLPTYEEWHKKFTTQFKKDQVQKAYETSVNDLRMLILGTEQGLYYAAGTPRFNNPFGRDAMFSTYMVLDYDIDVLRDTIKFLLANQGTTTDSFREERPGRILHEFRYCETARTSKVPFGRYYGGSDTNSLFIILFGEYIKRSQDIDFLKDNLPKLELALDWIEDSMKRYGGFVGYRLRTDRGVQVQAWKDHYDSMMHSDGTLGVAPIAVSEVQAYTYGALNAASYLYGLINSNEKAEDYKNKADDLYKRFNEIFWSEKIQNYAIGLEIETGKIMEVQNSNAGHLLWMGIIPEDRAKKVVKSLLSDDMWSGYGIRTLGKNEVLYNTGAYHNGSVWPFDTAVFAGGLVRYGMFEEFETIAKGIVQLAIDIPGHHIPELVLGYDKSKIDFPIPYLISGVPQAWSAAALLYLAGLSKKIEGYSGVFSLKKDSKKN